GSFGEVNEDDEARVDFNDDGGNNGTDGYDLEMTDFEAPTEIVFNQLGAITVGTVTNVGNQTSPPARIRVFFSDDEELDVVEDAFFASANIPALEPGASAANAPQQEILITEVNGRYNLNRNTPQNFWIVEVNRSSGPAEENTSNNVIVMPFNLVVPDYDVIVQADTPPPAEVEAGQLYDLDLSVTNGGSTNYSITIFDKGGSANSILDIATSPDIEVAAIQTLFRRPWSALPFASPDDMVIPANLPDGQYFLRWYVASNLTEVSKSNNVLTFPLKVGAGNSGNACAFVTPYRSEGLDFIPSSGPRGLVETAEGYTVQIGLPNPSFPTSIIDEYKLSLDGEVLSEEEISIESPYDVELIKNDDKSVDLFFARSPDLPDSIRVPIDINYDNPTDVILGRVFKTSNGYAFGIAIIDVDQDPLLVANRIFQTDNAGVVQRVDDSPTPFFFGGFGRLTEGPDGSLYLSWLTSGNFTLTGIPADGSPAWSFPVASDTPSTTWLETKLSTDGQFIFSAKTDNQQAFISKLNVADGSSTDFNINEIKTSSNPTGGFRQTRVNGILPTEDGGIIVVVQAFEVVGSQGSGAVIAKYDAANNLVWKQEYFDLPYAFAPVGVTSDGGILFAGTDNTDFSDRGSVFIKTTALGTLDPLCNPVSGEGMDLELSLSANNESPGIYGNFTITTTIRNTGTETASGILVDIGGCVPLPNDLDFPYTAAFNQSFNIVYANTNFPASKGKYDFLSQNWTIDELEPGASATLDINLFTLTTDPKILYANITSASGEDIDSTP
ncbi:MAG: hypothetical protein AAFO94_10170, partial [Bacteroidota bacterium]